MIKIQIPNYIENAMSLIMQEGFEAFVVGGAIRDALLGKEPTDWDIATNAKTEDVKAIFKNHYNTGLRHGTITAIVENCPVEITTYRTDGDYKDFRRPEKVFFTHKLSDDLLRRDFTINALAYNNIMGIVDICGGIHDLRHGIIRCVGDANKRLYEDALRVLRALRFCVTLNFEIEPKTYEAICRHASLLNKISAERICSELIRIIMTDKGMELLFETGVGNVILPELSKCFFVWQNNSRQLYDVGNHSLECMYNVPKTPVLRLAALLHDVGKVKTKVTDRWGVDHFPNHANVSASMAREILTRLKVSTKCKRAIVNLIKQHSIKIKPTEISVRKAVINIGKQDFINLLLLKKGNKMAQNPRYAREGLANLERIEEIFQSDIENNVPLSIKELAVDGNDMREIGLSGSDIGKMLNFILSFVIKDPEQNNREILLKIAANRKKQRNKEE